MDVFNGDLETIECAGFGDLDFLHETDTEVFVDDAVGSGEEGEDVGDEVAFVVVKGFPVLGVGTKVDFFRCCLCCWGLGVGQW